MSSPVPPLIVPASLTKGQRAKCMKVLSLLSFGFKFNLQKSHKKAELMTEIECTYVDSLLLVCGNVWNMILAFS